MIFCGQATSRWDPTRVKPAGAKRSSASTIGTLIAAFMMLLLLSPTAPAQKVELNGGYAHITGDLGLDGYNVGAAVWFSRRVSVALDYDSAYDTSKIGAFELTSAGEISVKSHIQNFLVGPRIYFPGALKSKKLKYGNRLAPFAEVQLGGTHLATSVRQITAGTQSASDNAFSWMLGGGAWSSARRVSVVAIDGVISRQSCG